MGKGGVGRSTVSAALGTLLASRGEKVLIIEWTIAEAIAPWFGLPPAGTDPCLVASDLSVMNYRLDTALRQYFVNHLGLGLFYRRVIAGTHVQRLIEAAPGIAELLFVGELFWLTTFAKSEAGLHFDRLIVDAPATGHGASLLELPTAIVAIGASGLLALEVDRVMKMMADASQTGVLVVTLPEELVIEETLELVPRVQRNLGRRPLAVIVNRSIAGLVDSAVRPIWLEVLAARLSSPARDGLETIYAELANRVRRERELRHALEGATALGTYALEDQLATADDVSPRAVIQALSAALLKQLGDAL
jgi:anion-transporting  ArsA/GET3 family ATPase